MSSVPCSSSPGTLFRPPSDMRPSPLKLLGEYGPAAAENQARSAHGPRKMTARGNPPAASIPVPPVDRIGPMSVPDRGFGTTARAVWRLAPLATLVALTLPTCGGASRPTVPVQPSPTPPPVTQPPTPTTLADLSASVTSPQA